MTGRLLRVNAAFAALVGRGCGEVYARSWWDLTHRGDREAAEAAVGAVAAGRGPVQFEQRFVRPSGTEVRAVVRMSGVERPTEDDPERGGAIVAHVRELAPGSEANQALRRLAMIVEVAADLVALCDVSGHDLHLNRAGRRLLGIDEDEDVRDLNVLDLFHPESRRRILREVLPVLRDQDVWRGELVLVTRRGREIPVSQVVHAHRGEDGGVEFFSTIARDVSERKRVEAELAHRALHDPLTGLPNRVLLEDRMAMAVARAQRTGARVAVAFFDLDHFKRVNDTLGHAAGDRVLATVGPRVRSVVRPADTVARLGGDEFAVVCEVRDDLEAMAVAERVRAAVSEPVVLDPGGEEIIVGASVGLVVATTSERAPGELLADADAAMYHAKEQGRGRIERFEHWMRALAAARLGLERALRSAIEHDELEVHHQPVLSLPDRRIVASEALLRWRHPERGLLDAEGFLGVADDAGLALQLASWATRAAFRDAASLHAVSPELRVWVNVAEAQLRHLELLDVLAAAASDAGIAPERIGLEIPAAVLAQAGPAPEAWLRAFRHAGIPVAADDFGAGPVPLTLLGDAGIGVVKLDPSLVSRLGQPRGSDEIVGALIQFAHRLGVTVSAEAVETPEQLRRLETLGCDTAQGFLLGRPQPVQALRRQLGQARGGPTPPADPG